MSVAVSPDSPMAVIERRFERRRLDAVARWLAGELRLVRRDVALLAAEVAGNDVTADRDAVRRGRERFDVDRARAVADEGVADAARLAGERRAAVVALLLLIGRAVSLVAEASACRVALAAAVAVSLLSGVDPPGEVVRALPYVCLAPPAVVAGTWRPSLAS
jgi:hypothetical protein